MISGTIEQTSKPMTDSRSPPAPEITPCTMGATTSTGRVSQFGITPRRTSVNAAIAARARTTPWKIGSRSLVAGMTRSAGGRSGRLRPARAGRSASLRRGLGRKRADDALGAAHLRLHGLAELLPDREADHCDQAEDDDVLDRGEAALVAQQSGQLVRLLHLLGHRRILPQVSSTRAIRESVVTGPSA